MHYAPSNDSVIRRDLAHLWHPCSQMKDHEWLPLIPIKRGRGVWVYDFDDNAYLDVISSWWVNLFGHANPRINAALTDQLEQLEHVILAGFSHEPVVRLSERLVELTPASLTRCFYADSGSAAIEIALKMSFHYWRNIGYQDRTRFVALSGGYHGETLGALAVGDVGLYKTTYAPLLMDAIIAPSPDCFHAEPGEACESVASRSLSRLAHILSERHNEICAVVVEPLVQCVGGMRMHDPSFLRGLRRLCDHYQVHLIADEIAVGFGRTGTLFACEQADIAPDFMCLSKGLTGGYLPLSTVLTTEAVYGAFYDDFTRLSAFLHSHSFTGNPLGCRAALAALDIFAEDDILARNAELAVYMGQRAQALAEHPHVAEVRQRGMIVAIEMVKDKRSREPFPWQERRGIRVYQHALGKGVLMRPLGNVVYFMPPYVINHDEIDLMVATAESGIDVATRD